MSPEPFLIPNADWAEQQRIRKLCGRLPRRNALREAAETLLNGFTPDASLIRDCIEILALQKAPKWRERTIAAWVLGVAPVPFSIQREAAETLARVVDNFDLQQDAGGRISRALARTAASVAACAFGAIFFFLLRTLLMFPMAFLMLLSLFGGVPASFVWDHRCTNKVREEAVTALGRLAAPEYLGALARGATDPAENVRSASAAALWRTLPHVTKELDGRLPWSTGAQLCGVLRHADPQLAVAILRVLPLIAGAEVIPTVERIAKRARTPELRDAASEVLPALYARRDRARQSEVLLRASGAQDAPSETLLRPFVNTGESEPELLLRPSTGEESA